MCLHIPLTEEAPLSVKEAGYFCVCDLPIVVVSDVFLNRQFFTNKDNFGSYGCWEHFEIV
jgi:hypothetical protein